MSTPAQRLAWQEQEDTGGLYADPSPEELDEVRDDEFRHWDSYTFLSGEPVEVRRKRHPHGDDARGLSRLPCSALEIDAPPRSPMFAQAASLTGRWEKDTRERPVAISSSSGDGAPLTQHTTARHNRIPAAGGCAGSEVGGPIRPPGAPDLASPSVERWMWTA